MRIRRFVDYMHLKTSFQCEDKEVERTKRNSNAWRGGRTENQSPVSVTTVEERKFRVGNGDWSSTSDKFGKKETGKIR